MLKIGEFSKLSRVSVRMLRHYDEIGLLPPASIDSATGYRYYSEDQLPVAGRIAGAAGYRVWPGGDSGLPAGTGESPGAGGALSLPGARRCGGNWRRCGGSCACWTPWNSD